MYLVGGITAPMNIERSNKPLFRVAAGPGKPENDREFSVTWRNREMTGNFFVDRDFFFLIF